MRLPLPLAHQLIEEARRAAPQEACGLLLGTTDDGEEELSAIVPTGNVHDAPRVAYRIDPRVHLHHEERAASGEGPPVLGFYHSHPLGPPFLSERDREEAGWDGRIHLLAWLMPEPGLGAWRWRERERRFEPVALRFE